MKTLPQAVQDYLAMRRALGYQLLNAGPALEDFVSFLKRKRTSYITITIALKWAQKAGAQSGTWANRLALVRGFARYRSATDPRTEVPPSRVLSWQSKRATPYLYTDDEVRLLLNVCLSLSPHDALRKWTYHGLLGLLAVTGMRLSEALSLRLSDVDLVECILNK
jgi:integrase/recombinase XerD